MIQGSSQIISPEIAIQLFNSHAPRAELSTLKQKYLEFILHQERHIVRMLLLIYLLILFIYIFKSNLYL